MARSPFLRLGKKTDSERKLRAPIRLGNFSNGEFLHEQTPHERRIEKEILGRSSAAVYGIDPDALRCKVEQTSLAQWKQVIDGELGKRRWAFQDMGGPRTRREFLALSRLTGGRPG